VAKVLKHTAKSKKGKLITVKRTVIVCTIKAATPTPDWLWGLEIPSRPPFRIVGHFHQWSGEGEVDDMFNAWSVTQGGFVLTTSQQQCQALSTCIDL
jgi:hypothetical protein